MLSRTSCHGHGQEPHHIDQPLNGGLVDLAHEDANQQEEHGGAGQDAHPPPAGDAVPLLATAAMPPARMRMAPT
jgi:hypothetical protein